PRPNAPRTRRRDEARAPLRRAPRDARAPLPRMGRLGHRRRGEEVLGRRSDRGARRPAVRHYEVTAMLFRRQKANKEIAEFGLRIADSKRGVLSSRLRARESKDERH